MRAKKIILLTLAALTTGFFGYESLRVFQARAETATRLQAILSKSDPQITKLSPARIDMLVRVEDPTFWTNDGTDFFTPGAGATTLTQGLGKNIYFEHFSPGFKKIELVLMSKFALSRQASKRDILIAVLNSAYWGTDSKGEIVGLAEAARRYYGQELNALSDDQYLSLIAMLPAPGTFNPAKHPQANAERVARIKRYLAGQCAPSGWGDNELDGCAAGS